MKTRSVLECGGPPPLSHAAGNSGPGQSARGLAQSKTWRQVLAFFCFLLSAFCFTAWGQYSLDWFTIDGGGGISTGGVYAVSGTIGQPDAGAMSGGNFTLQGGFWPGIVVPSNGEAPTLFIQWSGDSVVISWSPATAGFELEATADLAGAFWTAAPAGNPVTLPISSAARFYRLKKP